MSAGVKRCGWLQRWIRYTCRSYFRWQSFFSLNLHCVCRAVGFAFAEFSVLRLPSVGFAFAECRFCVCRAVGFAFAEFSVLRLPSVGFALPSVGFALPSDCVQILYNDCQRPASTPFFPVCLAVVLLE